MGLAEIKKELKALTKEQLVGLIADLYKKDKNVKEYLDFFANPDPTKLLEEYKTKVYECFFPKRGYKLDLKTARQAIAQFKKLGPGPEQVAALMLHFVEAGVEFTNAYGDIDEAFYNSMESMYLNALKLIDKNDLLPVFKDLAGKILGEADNTGWGFYDGLSDSFSQFYNFDDEE
jgi:hypothetical protein